MKALVARALGLIGAVALGTGLANMVAPGSTFPSAKTCITDFDIVICTTYPWQMATWLALAGAVAVIAAVSLVRRRPPLSDGPADGDAADSGRDA